MHILLIANYRYDRQESMQRYADMLESGLRERGVSVSMIRPEPYFGRLKPAGHGVGKWLGYIDKFIIFPIRLRWLVRKARGSSDGAPSGHALPAHLIVHICDHSNAMYAAHLKGVPHLVTCHDLLAVRSALGHFPQNPVGASGRILQKWVLSGLKQAHTVVCVSESTRRDLLAVGRTAADRTHVAYLGLNYPYRPMTESDSAASLVALPEVRDLGQRGYLFHIGGNQWYKNRAGLLRIYFEHIKQGGRLPLVLAGKAPTAAMQLLLSQAPAEARIILVGNVTNQQLNALYARAACLVFPSLYEGFGWPVLEALSVGTTVLCGNGGSLAELAAFGAVCTDVTHETNFAKLIMEHTCAAADEQANSQKVSALAKELPDHLLGVCKIHTLLVQ